MLSEKLIRPALQMYWRATRSLTLGAQGVLIDASDRVLLIRHTYRPGWHFPGGGVEKLETIEDALRREVREEAGAEITGQPQLFGLYGNHRIFPGDHVALFVVRDWTQAHVPAPTAEIAEQGLFAINALPEPMNPPTLARLSEIFKGAPRARHWS